MAALVMGLRTVPALPISRIHTAASGLSARLLSFLHVPIVVYFVSEWSHYDMSLIYIKDYPERLFKPILRIETISEWLHSEYK